MKRFIIIALTLLVLAVVAYVLDQYWIHRYDSLIQAEATRSHVDPDLVWSIVYEETYFSPWKKGEKGEIGLMQVTPTVARRWATESGASSTASDPVPLLQEAQHNVEIGCWYLGIFSDEYRNVPDREARMLAAYNAGDSRVIEWNRVPQGAPPLTEQQFIDRIDIASTRAYVTSILKRYRHVKSAKAQ
jgi:soluble lytic murein transglycosylase